MIDFTCFPLNIVKEFSVMLHIVRQHLMDKLGRPQNMRAIQLSKLNKLLVHAYKHVPYYRLRLLEYGITRPILNNLSEIQTLPFLVKDDLIKYPNAMRCTNISVSNCHRIETSGTTKTKVSVVLDKNRLICSYAAFFRRLNEYGLNALTLNKILNLSVHMRTKHFVRDVDVYMGFKHIFTVNPYSKDWESPQQLLECIREISPHIVTGSPSCLGFLAHLVEEYKLTLSPKVILSWGEILNNRMRSHLKHVFQVDVFDIYGLAEAGNHMWECKTHAGYHIDEDFWIIELLREDGHQCEFGEKGEIVITDLMNYAMPIIRYRTGDYAVYGDENCLCDRGFQTITKIEGRLLDFIVLHGDRFITPQQVQEVLDIPGISDFQVHQISLDEIIVKYVPDAKFFPSDKAIFKERSYNLFGPTVHLNFSEEESLVLGREAGKSRPVISQVHGFW